MAYGLTREEAARKAKTIALQVLADMIEGGEELRHDFGSSLHEQSRVDYGMTVKLVTPGPPTVFDQGPQLMSGDSSRQGK